MKATYKIDPAQDNLRLWEEQRKEFVPLRISSGRGSRALGSSEICTQRSMVMSHRGFSHIGLSTLDLDKTREFYEGVLGFTPVIADTIKIKEGGCIRHIFFDTGRDQLLAFIEPHKFQTCRQNTMQASTAASECRPPSIILRSRRARRPLWPTSVTSSARRA